VIEGELRRYTVSPEQVGLSVAPAEEVPGGNPTENAETARSIFAGVAGAARDLAVLNAGGAIYAAGVTESIEEGVRAAERSIDSGAADAALERFVNRTRELLASGASPRT
jgi:anthranilate phosphoribosyltransferase